MCTQNLNEDELGELRGCETGARQFRRPLANELFEEPSQHRRLRRSGSDMDQRRQDIRKERSAGRVQLDKTADLKALVTVPKVDHLADMGGKHRCRFNGNRGEIAGEYKGTLGREEKHVARFDSDSVLLTIHHKPAGTPDQGGKFQLIERRKPDRPRTSGRKAARDDRLSIS